MASAGTGAASTVVHMPFTLSHPALVLPLRRSGLPMAALVCGSMAPDLHMVVPGLSGDVTHAWTSLPTSDLALGLALTAVWILLLAPVVDAAAPQWVRDRLHGLPRYDLRMWLLAVPAVLVGVATHIGWDTFTHADMWGGQHIAWLYEMHHGYPGYQLSQYLSSVVGLLVCGLWAAWRLRSASRRAAPPARGAEAARWALAIPAALALVLGLFVSLALALDGHGGDVVVSAGLRTAMKVAAVGCGLAAVAWRLWQQPSSDPRG